MRQHTFISILLAFAVISFVDAQDLDKVLKMHYKAVGQKKLEKVNTIQASGNASVMQMENPFKMMTKRPNKLLVTFEFQGSQIKQAYDGETAWIINPFMGSDNAVEITGPEGDGLRESADMDGLLWNYKEKGHQLELEGSGEEDGKSVFILKLTKKTGNTDYYYIDQESYLVYKQKSKSFLNGVEVEVETFLSDYRDVEGCMMPFQTTQRADGQEIMNLKLNKVELNVPLDDALFAKPD
jgi:outer membrane lipoprotein-sorting protein